MDDFFVFREEHDFFYSKYFVPELDRKHKADDHDHHVWVKVAGTTWWLRCNLCGARDIHPCKAYQADRQLIHDEYYDICSVCGARYFAGTAQRYGPPKRPLKTEDVERLLGLGKTIKEVAVELGVSEGRVRHHVRKIDPRLPQLSGKRPSSCVVILGRPRHGCRCRELKRFDKKETSRKIFDNKGE